LLRLLLGQRGAMTPDGARDVFHARAAQAGVADVTLTDSGTLSRNAGWPAAGRSGTS
jgi:hypothetical protein